MKDLKIFLMYIFNPSGLIEGFREGFSKMMKPRTISTVLTTFAFLSLLFLPSPIKLNVMVLLLITALAIQLRVAYIGGDHRYWWKQRQLQKEAKNEEN